MPIPDTAGDCHYPVVERIGFVPEGLRDASEPLGSADGVFDLDAAAGVGTIIGALNIRQDRNGALFATPGLAVRQAAGRKNLAPCERLQAGKWLVNWLLVK